MDGGHLDQSQVKVLQSVVTSAGDKARSLHTWWNTLGRTLIYLAMETSALAVFTVLTAVLTYLVVYGLAILRVIRARRANSRSSFPVRGD
ncbi:hypothetical protein L226DRAFT_576776 [Lentinus tigrinus ALCF2SS1-7]|uniref:Uncharacterized protein n=1 Tax=Lentinus tigrinus ALCF2SS1-6 TaxID=1328759 RepID=A0A5C2RS84_9APHY|nr:hypothetical protein L227DRAFT_616695 [Lentinus tigrinus ALCF2SS1-6]RPD68002.1 hypothetical protein L226DRAFT_576776 [Lentinus tigrinus ALCF2SS1-7]